MEDVKHWPGMVVREKAGHDSGSEVPLQLLQEGFRII
jgi:hypothetical protein